MGARDGCGGSRNSSSGHGVGWSAAWDCCWLLLAWGRSLVQQLRAAPGDRSNTRGAERDGLQKHGKGNSRVPVSKNNTSDGLQQTTTTLSARSRRCVTNKKGS